MDLRQWVLSVPFAWRKRLDYDPLVSALTRIFVKTVLGFYRERDGGPPRGQSGAVVAVQRTSSDLKLKPHAHAVFLDGAYRDKSDELDFFAELLDPGATVRANDVVVDRDWSVYYG